MNIKYNVFFFLDKEKDKTDAKIRMRIRLTGGEVIAFNVGYRANIEKWDANIMRCKRGTTHGKDKTPANEINSEIQRFENIAKKVINSYELKEKKPNSKEFREAFNHLNGKESKVEKASKRTFYQRFDQFVSERGVMNSWSAPTYTKFSALKNHLLEFDKELSFDALDENKLSKLVQYFRDIDLKNTTILKQFSFLRWFLNWSEEKGYCKNITFKTFKPNLKTTQKKVIFLTWNELMILYNFQFDEKQKHLERVRDCFCFCCFTSLRYSDLANLKHSNIKNGKIEFVTIKTADRLVIELNKYSSAILNKYSNANLENDKILPVISNQKMNDEIKDVCRIAGINDPITTTWYEGSERKEETLPKWKLIGTHCGRRTFVVNALSMGISPQIVMKFTGHSSYNSMKPYIDIIDQERENAMDKFDKKDSLTDEATTKALEALKGLSEEQIANVLSKLNKDGNIE